MIHELDLPQPRTFRTKTLVLSCAVSFVVGLGAGPASTVLMNLATNRVVAVYHGVPVTFQMERANRIFRQGLSSTNTSRGMTDFIDNWARENIDAALEEYKANPRASYPQILLGRLQTIEAMAGGEPTPEMVEAERRLRAMSFE